MLCLGIESSCDETALALVCDGRLSAQVLRSQTDLHALFGGVVPELASREHARCIGPLYDLLCRQTGLKAGDLDYVAVARGPGLLGSLLVGVSFAKALALSCGARILAVNHLHAHLLAAGLGGDLLFPALGLLVSGGHTHIYRMDGPRSFTLLGRSIDDAAGEAFDKFGKALGLPYPAGRQIDELASKGVADIRLFPRPYLDNDNLDFSFSGLKTAAVQLAAGRPDLSAKQLVQPGDLILPADKAGQDLADVCASFTLAVAETLRLKLERALKKQAGIKALILAGGVAANSFVRQGIRTLADARGLPLLLPEPDLCTDNAAMIAYAGWLLAGLGQRHELDFRSVPRGQKIPEDALGQD